MASAVLDADRSESRLYLLLAETCPELLNLFELRFLTNQIGMTLISSSPVVGRIK